MALIVALVGVRLPLQDFFLLLCVGIGCQVLLKKN